MSASVSQAVSVEEGDEGQQRVAGPWDPPGVTQTATLPLAQLWESGEVRGPVGFGAW
jgi:hypothetical protein